MDIKESDWKRFRALHPIALERYAQRSLAEMQYYFTDKSQPALRRFWGLVAIAQKREKEIREIFDDMRRSTALLQIARIFHEKLLTDDELATFSPDTRDFIHRYLRIGKE